MRAAGRFVVEAHGHITTLCKSKGQSPGDYFGGLTNTFSDGEVEYFDNSVLTQRMFMSGRLDVRGIHWEKSVPKPGRV